MTWFAALVSVPGWVQPLWMVPAVIAAGLGAMALVYLLLVALQPKVAALARTAALAGWNQPLFWVELGLGVTVLLFSAVMPYFTFGDDVRMMKETSLTVVKVLAILLAVWLACVSIADELEGRTALTLLCKPVSRAQFIVGKFLGVLAPTLSLFIILGGVLLATVSFKVVYESTIPMSPAEASRQCYGEMAQLVPAMFLAFLETVVLTSISVMLSTRLAMVSNMVISGTVYVVGHLVPLLVQSKVGENKIVTFIGQLLATLLPVLDHFDASAALATGGTVPLDYLLWTTLYAAIYSTIAMLLAMLLFEERDLA